MLEPESVLFLEMISLLPVLLVFMLYRYGVQFYKYLFFFYKEAFYGVIYSLILGKTSWSEQRCVLVFFSPGNTRVNVLRRCLHVRVRDPHSFDAGVENQSARRSTLVQ